MKNAGAATIARPMATRWRCPPESSRGLRFAKVLEAQHSAASTRLSISAFASPS